jgi:hypothetical protein
LGKDANLTSNVAQKFGIGGVVHSLAMHIMVVPGLGIRSQICTNGSFIVGRLALRKTDDSCSQNAKKY